MNEQLKRLDTLLGLIASSDVPTAHDLLITFLDGKLNIPNRQQLEAEIEMLIAILKENDHIIEEENGTRTFYRATKPGVDFLAAGGYEGEFMIKDAQDRVAREYQEKQAKGYVSPKVAVVISCLALAISIFFSTLNYFTGNPTKRIEQLERRLDSLQSSRQVKP